MTCSNVLIRNPHTVAADAPLRNAVALLRSHRIKALPVVDARGKYLGLFGIRSLMQHILPRAATLGAAGGIADLGFMHDSLQDVRDRYQALLDRPVADLVDASIPRLSEQTPLMEALLLLHRHNHLLPVVDASGALVGIVTTWEVFSRVAFEGAE